MTGILSSLHVASTEHIISHETIEVATITLFKDRHIGLMEPGVGVVCISYSAPARDNSRARELGTSIRKTGWLDVWEVIKRDRSF